MAPALSMITKRRFVFAVLPCLLFVAVLNQILFSQSSEQPSDSSMLWRAIRKQLSSPNSREFFEEKIKNSALPTLYGTLVHSSPADQPNTFLVAMDGKKDPEIRLKLNFFLPKPLPEGIRIAFEGIGVSFTAEPFLLTLKLEELQRVVDVPSRPGKKP